MIVVLLVVVCFLFVGSTGRTKKDTHKARKKKKPRRVSYWLIVYRGEYWTGYNFSRSQNQAQRYRRKAEAWGIVDERFSADIAEDCHLTSIAK